MDSHAPPPGPSNATAVEDEPSVGNYFVANYPPFSVWKPEFVSQFEAALERPPAPGAPLGIYLHIPFCRKRCHFCYYRVYTDRDASEIRAYVDALLQELRLYAGRPFIGGRKPAFVYFGGGTPSYLSVEQLRALAEGMKDLLPWDAAEEITFEAEPGTLTEHKLRALGALGVTRLSLGVENFDDHVLEINGRAHHSKEIHRAYGFAREVGFPQINIDLIAGMLEETDANWRSTVRQTIDLEPDSVTIYQMEIPFNTTIYRRMKEEGKLEAPVADWDTKRRWTDEAFRELESAGYTVASAYTAVKDPSRTRFVYRDRLWAGADLLALGVSSFGIIHGTHYQNEHDSGPYLARLREGKLPVYRALTPTAEERLVRELVLQLKLGRVSQRYFEQKFGADIRERFAEPIESLAQRGMLAVDGDRIALSRAGLLRVDSLLHEFFLPEHRKARYS